MGGVTPEGGSEKEGGVEHPLAVKEGWGEEGKYSGVVSTTKKGTQPRDLGVQAIG